MVVCNPVCDLFCRGTACHRSFNYSLWDSVEKSWIKWRGNYVVGTEFKLPTTVGSFNLLWHCLCSYLCERQSSSHLHLVVYEACAAVEGTSKQEGETHHIVDLVGVVGAASGNDGVG